MQRLMVQRFMAIESAEVEVTNMLILIGEQASGKSTLAKLIYFFKSLREEYVTLLVDSDNSDLDIQKAFWAVIGRKFYRIFGSIQKLAKFDIRFYFSEQKYIQLQQGEFDDGRKKLVIKLEPNDWFQNLLYREGPRLLQALQSVQTRRYDFENVTYRRVLRDITSFAYQSFDDSAQTLVFHPAGRNATVAFNDFFEQAFSQFLAVSGEKSRGYSEAEAASPAPSDPLLRDVYLMYQFMQHVATIKSIFRGNDFSSLLLDRSDHNLNEQNNNSAAHLLADKASQILRGTYTHNGYEKILFAGGEVPLSDASSGQQEAIRILQDIFLVVLNQENACRIIEEPEAHLFPEAQKLLLEMIAIMLNSTNSQVTLTTHSPYILSVANILLFTYQVKGSHDAQNGNLGIKPQDCRVYVLTGKGKCHSVLDKNTGLIDQNILDSVSMELANQFSQLYQMYLEM